MVEAGLSPATSTEYRAAFKRAKKLFDASQRRPSFNQGASVVVSEDVEPGLPKRPIPCIYPEKMIRPYGPSTGFDVERDYARLYDIAWMQPTRDTLVIVYRGADGGEGTVRMRMPMPEDHNAVASFNEMKSDYLKKLTGGSGPIDTRSIVDVLRAMDEKTGSIAKVAKVAKVLKVDSVPVPVPVPQSTRLAYLEELCAAQRKDLDTAAEASEIRRERWNQAERHCVYLESVVAELRDEVIRLTNELNEARECADTDAADALRANQAADELRAEVNALRHLRPKGDIVPPVLLSNPIARA
jgi:hypothetical protein